MSAQKALKKAYKLIDNEEFEECIRHADRALEIFKNNSDIYSIRGEAKFKLKFFDSALVDFNRAAELEPNNSYRFSSRAFLKDAMGDTKGAVEDYKIAYQLDPEDATILNNLGVLEEKLGYKEAAKRKFKIADEIYHLDQKNTPKITEPKKNTQEITKAPESDGFFQMVKKIFSNKNQRNEFFQFVKNGFKLK